MRNHNVLSKHFDKRHYKIAFIEDREATLLMFSLNWKHHKYLEAPPHMTITLKRISLVYVDGFDWSTFTQSYLQKTELLPLRAVWPYISNDCEELRDYFSAFSRNATCFSNKNVWDACDSYTYTRYLYLTGSLSTLRPGFLTSC